MRRLVVLETRTYEKLTLEHEQKPEKKYYELWIKEWKKFQP